MFKYGNALIITEGPKLVAQAVQFFVAGFETTSTTMAFTLYELCLHPHIQDKVRTEIVACLKQYGFTYEALKEMKYLHQCVLGTYILLMCLLKNVFN